MASNAVAPARGRIAEFFGSVPLVTLVVMTSCVIIYVVEVAGDFWSALALFSLSPATVFGDLQLYRIVTAAFTHASVMHVGMNMLSFVALGSSLEALLGSIAFAFLLSTYVVVVGTVFLLLGTFASLFDSRYWYQAAVGFSGVIFALAVDECALSPAPTRSIFGFFSVPTRLYPWVLLLILQFLLPNVSFLGHLAGILVGIAHVGGVLRILIPGQSALKHIETSWLPSFIFRAPQYRLVPAAEPVVIQMAMGAEFLATQLRALSDCVAALRRRLPAVGGVLPSGGSTAAAPQQQILGAGGAAPRDVESADGATAPSSRRADGFAPVPTEEETPDDNNVAPLLRTTGSAVDMTPLDVVARREKMAAAALARAIAAASVGRPSLSQGAVGEGAAVRN